MIISHKHKFIFIKTMKTAGTSVEIALSKHCGPDDVITPISPEDEVKRAEIGGISPQNYRVPLSRYTGLDWFKAIKYRKPLEFFNHVSAEFVMEHIDPTVWDSYYKFTFERDPWDKAVSDYFWHHKSEPRPPITEFVHSRRCNRVKGFNLYTVDSQIVVDQVFKYEEMPEAIAELERRFGFALDMPKTKAGTRKDRRHYSEVLSTEDIDQIGRVFARECAFFGYKPKASQSVRSVAHG